LPRGRAQPHNRAWLESETGGADARVIDHHVHIGQWYERYYTPSEVFDTVFGAGIAGLVFSSTSSCINDIRYTQIEREIHDAINRAENAEPLFWYLPDYSNQGVSIEAAMQALPYKGFKIHPRAHGWDLTDSKTIEIAHSIFDYADRHAMPVLIHTGEDEMERADKFEQFFGAYSRVKIILAHCRPLDTTIKLLGKYANVFCDTAFVPPAHIEKIREADFDDKIYFGTDFPITHYWAAQKGEHISLKEQYAQDSAIIHTLSDIPVGGRNRGGHR
jgi:predicted TIM-barrel fold metal-dependent hydrolase